MLIFSLLRCDRLKPENVQLVEMETASQVQRKAPVESFPFKGSTISNSPERERQSYDLARFRRAA
jgi:hypothetical protein